MGVGLKMQEESERKARRLILSVVPSVVPWRRRSPRVEEEEDLSED
jgi:hypothetical protein